MTYLELIDECPELLAERNAKRRYQARLAAHPDPRDPDWPGHDEDPEAEPEPLDALIAFLRGQCDLAEKHIKAGRRENAVLALCDADFEIAEALGLS